MISSAASKLSPYASEWGPSPAEEDWRTDFNRSLPRGIETIADASVRTLLTTFSDKLFHHNHKVRTLGITLASHITEFPEGSGIVSALCLEIFKLMSRYYIPNTTLSPFIEDFLAESFTNLENLINFTNTPAQLVPISSIPEHVLIPAKWHAHFFKDHDLIEDPQIALYKIFTRFNATPLSSVDKTIEMRLSLILANYEKQIFENLPVEGHDPVEGVENMIDYVLNELAENPDLGISSDEIIARIEQQYYYMPHKIIQLRQSEYLNSETGRLSRMGVKALLYSTSHLIALKNSPY